MGSQADGAQGLDDDRPDLRPLDAGHRAHGRLLKLKPYSEMSKKNYLIETASK